MYSKNNVSKTKDKYLRFIADWPNRYERRGKNFKQLLAWNGLPLWWLSGTQQKDPEGSPAFRLLCELEATGRLAEEKLRRPRPIVLEVLGRLRFLSYLLAKVVMFKLFIKKTAPAGRELLFVSIYGNTLKPAGGQLIDRYYLDLPAALREKLGLEYRYLSFYYGSLVRLFKQRRELARPNTVFYEHYLTVGDILRAFDLFNLIRYIRIERRAAFRNSFVYNDHNVYPLFAQELRVSFAGSGIPELILLAQAAERIARARPVAAVTCFMEMYPYSRALYFGVKRGRPAVKTVAYQHATITPNKLWYVYDKAELAGGLPLPDYFLFTGELGRELVLKSGYPAERALLTGSPRFDSLAALKPEPIATILPAGRPVVLVTTAYAAADAQRVIDLAVAAARQRPDWFFVFKGHPHCPVDGFLRGRGIGNYAVSKDNVHQLILRAAALVTSYSMTADEAIALGCPVISVQNDELIDMSTFFAIEAALRVRDERELSDALDAVVHEPARLAPYKDKWPELVRATFFRIDGRAQQRVLEAFGRILGKEAVN